MANPYINIYQDNPTAGATDGTAVSLGNSFNAPIRIQLNAEINESKTIPLAIRTETGYLARDVQISDYNDDDNDRFKLCKTEDGDFSDAIVFEDVGQTNTLFYLKASSSATEQPQIDRSVKLKFTGVLVTV